ncbi:hypothetical protein Pcinc_014527 [Petrolisthes cinctipes]|uniref:Uncharacterized protein n=1 Tax=Petrolisthes cinctipes TaxID=88211 RepID=A0AAE1FXM2_PETCI|nr:hypothetical protein Pcinc_014527 [Petrolisthes cinctipes]
MLCLRVLLSQVLVLVVLVLVVVGVTEGALLNLLCPFPEGEVHGSEVECGEYTACEWSEGVCLLKEPDSSSYRVVTETKDTGRGFQVLGLGATRISAATLG